MVHSELEHLARLLFESGGILPDIKTLSEERVRESVAVGVVEVEGGKLAFTDADTRDEYIACYAAARASEAWDDPNRVLDLLAATRRVAIRTGTSHDLGAQVLRLLHERHNRDVLALVTDLARGGEASRHQFWSLYNDFCHALPEIEVKASALAEALYDISTATAGDLAGGFVYAAVEELARRSEGVAEGLIAEFLSRSGSPVVSFASSALIGLAHVNAKKAHQIALGWTWADEADVRRAGLAVLSRFPYKGDADSFLTATNERFAEMRNSPDPETDYALIRAHSNLLGGTPGLRQGLEELTGREDPSSRHETAAALMAWKGTETKRRWWLTGIQNLAHTPAEQAGTLNLIDHALAAAADSDSDVAIGFLEHFVSERTDEALNPINVVELFPMTSGNLQTHGKEPLQAAVTRWFASTDNRLHRVAHDFVQGRSRPRSGEQLDALVLHSAELSKLDERTLVHTLKRIMGWAVGGRPLAALLLSALQRPPENSDTDPIGDFVEEGFYNFVLYHYPGDAGDFLRQKAAEHEGTRAGTIASRALDKSEEYYQALRGLPELQELRPPDRRLHLIGRSHATMQAKILDEASKRSVLMELVRRVPLKYGRGFFSRTEDGKFSTTEGLKSFSQEVELPRGEVINPVGMAVQRLMLRRAGLVDDAGESGWAQ
jgi:hypothetical protein